MKIKIADEAAYLTAICGLALAVALVAASGFGVSMIVAPAYVLSRKFTALTFGQMEYVVQGVLFILFCILMGGFRTVYLGSFVNCLIYGAVLDFWRCAVPVLNPALTPPGSLPLLPRILLFAAGLLLTAVSVSAFYNTYLYPQVYDFFVRGVSGRFGIRRLKFKLCFDLACLGIATVLTLCFFGKFVGVGIGTVITACTMGFLIEFFCGIYKKYLIFEPHFKEFAKKFELK